MQTHYADGLLDFVGDYDSYVEDPFSEHSLLPGAGEAEYDFEFGRESQVSPGRRTGARTA
jgi:hypothetical protein